MIEVENLTKRYRDRVAIDALNFSVKDGQVVGFAAHGYGACSPGDGGPVYRAPTGAFRTRIVCRRDGATAAAGATIALDWQIRYRPE